MFNPVSFVEEKSMDAIVAVFLRYLQSNPATVEKLIAALVEALIAHISTPAKP